MFNIRLALAIKHYPKAQSFMTTVLPNFIPFRGALGKVRRRFGVARGSMTVPIEKPIFAPITPPTKVLFVNNGLMTGQSRVLKGLVGDLLETPCLKYSTS